MNAKQSVPVVTIDGPAASGKSSVSRELAKTLGWDWVSTGAFYRGLAFVAVQQNYSVLDETTLVELAHSDVWMVRLDADKTRVIWQGKDVTDEISKEEVGNMASQVSQFPKVRAALLDAQRQCAIGVVGLVAEGRDCGTVVFPNANVKIFLTARSEDRAARRAKDEGKTVEETHDAQKIRDAQDANRKAAPMQIAPDSHVIDTSLLDLPSVVAEVEALVRANLTNSSLKG